LLTGIHAEKVSVASKCRNEVDKEEMPPERIQNR